MRATRPPAATPRVWRAALIALLIGGVTFLIWWATGPESAARATLRERSEAAGEAPRMPAESAPQAGLPQAVADQTEPAGAHVPPAAGPVMPRGGVLRAAVDPRDLDSAAALLTTAALVRISPATDEVQPWLAESWIADRGGLTYRFTLRPNILWSDGTPLTGADVVRALELDRPRLKALGSAPEGRADGPRTVVVSFPDPFAAGLRLLAYTPIVRPPAGPNGRQGSGIEPPGLGPFVVDASDGSAARVFRRNPHYWRTAPDGASLPYLEGVELTSHAGASALALFRSGKLDLVETELEPDDYSSLKRADQDGSVHLYDLGPTLQIDTLLVGGRSALLQQEPLRLALSSAVDRRALCEAVYLGACDPAFGPVSPGNRAWMVEDLPSGGPDPGSARSLMAGIGLQDRNGDGLLDDPAGQPVRFAILVDRGVAVARRGAQFVSDALGKIGLAAAVVPVDGAELARRRASGDFDLLYARVGPVDTDPALGGGTWTGGRAVGGAREEWTRGLADDVARLAHTADKVQRLELFARVQKTFAAHMPDIPLAAPSLYAVTSPRVMNVRAARRRPALLWNAEGLAIAR